MSWTDDLVNSLKKKTKEKDSDEPMNAFDQLFKSLEKHYNVGTQLRPLIGTRTSTFYTQLDRLVVHLADNVRDASKEASNRIAIAIFCAIITIGLFTIVSREHSTEKQRRKSNKQRRKK
mgnify:CR=1 FL=1